MVDGAVRPGSAGAQARQHRLRPHAIGAALAVGSVLVGSLAGACVIRSKPSAVGEGGEPCTRAIECPPPPNPCLMAACTEQQRCEYWYAPEGSLSEDQQIDGDCKQRYCNGQGEVVDYPARYDVPPDDGNPCTTATCDEATAGATPLPLGTPCADGGICNGEGICGVCRPGEERCEGNAVRTCAPAGQWSDPAACELAAPVCQGARCVAVAELAVGDGHSCGRFDDNTVRCWGRNDHGQLGSQGLGTAQPPPWNLGFITAAVSRRHGCGIEQNRTVWCWGANDFGQIGDGTYESPASPLPASVTDATQVAVGANHSCALTAAGGVVCWGRNDHGQLGSGSAPAEPLAVTTWPAGGAPQQARPKPIAKLSDASGLQLHTGLSCVRLASNGELSCWGRQRFAPSATLDDPDELTARQGMSATTPTAVPGLTGVQRLAAGADFTCALLGSGTIQCWGANDRGQLGTSTKKDSFRPAAIPKLTGVRTFELGEAFGCALLESGAVSCWGANDHGQLGRRSQQPSGPAAPVSGLAAVGQLGVGDHFACALRQDKRLVCWGAGAAGQLGNGSKHDAPIPVAPVW